MILLAGIAAAAAAAALAASSNTLSVQEYYSYFCSGAAHCRNLFAITAVAVRKVTD